MHKRPFIMLFIICILLLCACMKAQPKLKLGIIKPSINHLPLSLLMQENQIAGLQPVYFSSGWEAQEALISGKIDAAIMPFTYVYTAVAKNYPLKIVSFLERESDAVVVSNDIKSPSELNGQKIGLLKASSVDLLMHSWAKTEGFEFVPVYFRTPNEMTGALDTGAVKAIVAYVPVIQKMQQHSVLHWFGEEHPQHPCCDLVVNSTRLDDSKKAMLKQLMVILEQGLATPKAEQMISYLIDNHGQDSLQALQALRHTVFKMGLDVKGIAFERQLMQQALELGYLKSIPLAEDIYLNLD